MDATPLKGIFNATAIASLKQDCLYRVYVSPRELFFIRVQGQDIGRAFAIHFGLLGALISYLLSGRRERAFLQKIKTMDEKSPEELLPLHKRNFKTAVSSIVESTLEPRKLFGHRPHIGRWTMTTSDGIKTVFEMTKVEDMKTAQDVLSKLLGGLLKVHVRWDEKKRRFVKVE